MISSIKNICIYGIGGVGGYFGGMIAHTVKNLNKPYKVFFIARGEHLKKIKENGLILHTDKKKDLICIPDIATDNINELPDIDLLLICVKGYDLISSAQTIRKKINQNTVIIPLLNGVDIYDRIKPVLNTMVLPSCTYLVSKIERPGVVTQESFQGRIICGKDPEYTDFNPDDTISFFNEMKLNFAWHENSLPAIWEKYLLIAAFGLVTAYANKTYGELLNDAKLKDYAVKIMREICAIADKKNITLPADAIEATLKKVQGISPNATTSYQRDVEQKDRADESDLLGGTITRLSKEFNVSTPVTNFVYSEILKKKPYKPQ